MNFAVFLFPEKTPFCMNEWTQFLPNFNKNWKILRTFDIFQLTENSIFFL